MSLAIPRNVITILVLSTDLLYSVRQFETLGVATGDLNVKRTCEYLARGSGPGGEMLFTFGACCQESTKSLPIEMQLAVSVQWVVKATMTKVPQPAASLVPTPLFQDW